MRQIVTFSLSLDVAEKVRGIPKLERSRAVNEVLRRHLGRSLREDVRAIVEEMLGVGVTVSPVTECGPSAIDRILAMREVS